MENEKIKILQNNVQSIRPIETREQLAVFLNREQITLASLQEIWIKENEKYRIKGYNFLKKCRDEGFGGVGLLIKEGLAYEEIQLGNLEPLEIVAAKTKNLDINFTIISTYVPPGSEQTRETIGKINELFKLIDSITGEVILTGDFNARHPLWEEEARPCERGRTVASELETSKLILLNDGQPTTIPRINASPTAIDLTFATRGIAAKMEWTVEEEEFGSAHMCIVMEIQTTIPIAKRTVKKVNVEKAIEGINTIQPQFMYDPEEMQEIFEEKIEEASYVIRNKKANYLKKVVVERNSERIRHQKGETKEF